MQSYGQRTINSNGQRWKWYQLEDGLPSLMVERIIEDQRGQLWIGSYAGLVKYDGKTFEKVLDGKVGAILEDNKGYIWVGTERDLIRYDPKTKKTKSFYYKTDRTPQYRYDIISLEQDFTGSLCAGTGYGPLVRLVPMTQDSFSITLYPTRSHTDVVPGILYDSIPGTWHWSSITDHRGVVWIGNGAGLVEIVVPDPQRPGEIRFRQVVPQFEPYSSGEKSIGISALNHSNRETIWMAGYWSDGPDLNDHLIFEFNPKTNKFIEYQTSQPPDVYYRCILEDDMGNLWAGPHAHALQFIDKKDITPVDGQTKKIEVIKNVPFSDKNISVNNTQRMLQDQSGSIWALHNFAGVFQMSPHFNRFNHFPLDVPEIKDATISAFLELSPYEILISTWGGQLISIDPSSGQAGRITSLFPDGKLTGIYRDSKERIWISASSAKLFSFDHQTGSFVENQLIHPGDFGFFDRAFLSPPVEDKTGKFWMGSSTMGLIYFDPDRKKLIYQFTPTAKRKAWLKGPNVTTPYVDGSGTLWFGTLYSGLYRTKPQEEIDSFRFGRYLTDIPLIFKVMADDNGLLWIATQAHGLILFDPEKEQIIKRFTIDQGLPSNNIGDFVFDSLGNIWTITASGVCYLDKETDQITVYNDQYGLAMEQLQLGRGILTSDGQLYFNGAKGYYKFDPSGKLSDAHHPGLIFKDLLINNRKIEAGNNQISDLDFQKSLILDHDENNFSIDYIGLNFSNPEDLTYSYCLENYHDQWQEVGKETTARFANIRPGNYRFHAIVMSGNLQTEKSFAIKIRSPWWFSWWAKSAYVLAASALLFALLSLRKRAEVEKMEKLKLIQQNDLRSKFFANISHEFRTPLTLIKSPVDDKIMLSENTKEISWLKAISQQTDRMIKLVNELLDLSKIDAGKYKLRKEQGEIFHFLKVCVEAFDSLAKQRSIRYNIDIPGDKFQLHFDPNNLEKVITNLLSNAFRYAGQQGKVDFISRYDTALEILEITVNNDGTIIPEDELETVFHQFYQASNATRQGSGVGLALVKEIVDLMEGDISVQSSEINGTTFTVKLNIPCAKGIKSNGSDLLPKEIVQSPERDASASFKASPQVDPEEELVLIVEDNEDVQKYLGNILSQRYRIIFGKNGLEGFEKAKNHVPDIIISDLMMPVMNGVDLARELKGNLITDHIPVILLTAKVDLDSRIEGINAGAEVYLQKPFNAEELRVVVARLISERQRFKRKILADLESNDFSYNDGDSAETRFLHEVSEAIKVNLDNPEYTVVALASQMHLSRTHFHKKMKSICGQSPSEFMRNLRLREAAKMIRMRRDNINQIAYATGFDSPSYFSRAFKKKYGVTPSEYGNTQNIQ